MIGAVIQRLRVWAPIFIVHLGDVDAKVSELVGLGSNGEVAVGSKSASPSLVVRSSSRSIPMGSMLLAEVLPDEDAAIARMGRQSEGTGSG